MGLGKEYAVGSFKICDSRAELCRQAQVYEQCSSIAKRLIKNKPRPSKEGRGFFVITPVDFDLFSHGERLTVCRRQYQIHVIVGLVCRQARVTSNVHPIAKRLIKNKPRPSKERQQGFFRY